MGLAIRMALARALGLGTDQPPTRGHCHHRKGQEWEELGEPQGAECLRSWCFGYDQEASLWTWYHKFPLNKFRWEKVGFLRGGRVGL